MLLGLASNEPATPPILIGSFQVKFYNQNLRDKTSNKLSKPLVCKLFRKFCSVKILNAVPGSNLAAGNIEPRGKKEEEKKEYWVQVPGSIKSFSKTILSTF